MIQRLGIIRKGKDREEKGQMTRWDLGTKGKNSICLGLYQGKAVKTKSIDNTYEDTHENLVIDHVYYIHFFTYLDKIVF